jgi:hypothetical protein
LALITNAAESMPLPGQRMIAIPPVYVNRIRRNYVSCFIHCAEDINCPPRSCAFNGGYAFRVWLKAPDILAIVWHLLFTTPGPFRFRPAGRVGRIMPVLADFDDPVGKDTIAVG